MQQGEGVLFVSRGKDQPWHDQTLLPPSFEEASSTLVRRARNLEELGANPDRYADV